MSWMSELLGLVFDLFADLICGLLEIIFPGPFEADTRFNQILWGVLLLLLAGLIWWELR